MNLATSYIYILQSFWRVNGEIPSNLDFLFLVVVPYKIKPGISIITILDMILVIMIIAVKIPTTTTFKRFMYFPSLEFLYKLLPALIVGTFVLPFLRQLSHLQTTGGFVGSLVHQYYTTNKVVVFNLLLTGNKTQKDGGEQKQRGRQTKR